jgi:hypothetical protein
MSAGVRLRTDRQTFEQWARAMPGVVLPAELQFAPAGQVGGAGETALPPVVAASLALHGCAEVAVTLRRWQPDQSVFSCFSIAGELAASLLHGGDEVEVGLFGLSCVVPEVMRLVPAEPPPIEGAADSAGVEVTVIAADAATGGWQQTLVGGGPRWRRVRHRAAPARAWLEPVRDVHQELAADLRFALADCIGGNERETA